MAKIFHICTLLFTVAAQTWAFAPPRLPQSSAVGLLLSSNLDDIDPKETALVLIEYQVRSKVRPFISLSHHFSKLYMYFF